MGIALQPPAATRAIASFDVLTNDVALREANENLTRDLGQLDLTSTLEKADALFTAIMDPSNPDTKKLVEDLFYQPMTAITKKAHDSINAVDLAGTPERVKEQMQIVVELFEISTKVRETCLDHVYDNMSRQIDNFAGSVETYNRMMKATVEQALEMYQTRVDAEIEVRMKILEQKKEEALVMLEVSAQEATVECANAKIRTDAMVYQKEQNLVQQQKKDARDHEKEVKALERQGKKDQQEL